jgi:hypothetical protein
VPFGLVIVTGILLQLKKQFPAIQPPTGQGSGDILQVDFDDVLAEARATPELGVTSWDDIERLDVRPDRNLIKVRGKNHWELQLDAGTGEPLQVMHRRSDLIESLHDGSWFHANAKLWLFLPVGIIVFLLWLTGLYLFFLPHVSRARRKS